MTVADTRHINFMEVALQEAALAAERGEVPVGCVIVDSVSGDIVARNGIRVEELRDPTAHAEMLVLRETTKAFGETRLPEDIFMSLEPCPMCAMAISLAHPRLYFGAADVKGGGVENGPAYLTSPLVITDRTFTAAWGIRRRRIVKIFPCRATAAALSPAFVLSRSGTRILPSAN